MLAAVMAAAVAMGGGSRSIEPPTTGVESSSTRIERAIVRSATTEFVALADALRARIPGVEVLPYEAASFAALEGKSFAYVEVAGEPGGTLTLTVVLHDRRAFVREFVADPEDPVRSIAAVVANTIAGIEQEEAVPDRVDAEIPRPEPESEPESESEPEPEPEPEPESEPVSESTPDRVDVGVALHGGAVVGLSRVQASASAGLGVGGAFRNGLVVEGEVRWAGAVASGFVLSRLRLAALVGYRYRRGSFELVAVGGPSVEPWFLTESGSLTTTRNSGGRSSAPLIGGLASVMPGLRLDRDRFALRIGARLDLAGSILPSGRAATIKRTTPPRTLFTFGGPELMAGLSIALWL